MEIKNYTPHTINVYKDDQIILSLKSDGLARCSETSSQIGTINGIDIYKKSFSSVYGLPAEAPNTFYIVSNIVANAMKFERSDLLVVNDTVRNEAMQIIGCRSFAKVSVK